MSDCDWHTVLVILGIAAALVLWAFVVTAWAERKP